MLPVLEALDLPSPWLVGGEDASVPTAWSVANLERIASAHGRPIPVRLYPDGDRGLRVAGSRFRRIRYRPEVRAWLEQRGVQ